MQSTGRRQKVKPFGRAAQAGRAVFTDCSASWEELSESCLYKVWPRLPRSPAQPQHEKYVRHNFLLYWANTDPENWPEGKKTCWRPCNMIFTWTQNLLLFVLDQNPSLFQWETWPNSLQRICLNSLTFGHSGIERNLLILYLVMEETELNAQFNAENNSQLYFSVWKKLINSVCKQNYNHLFILAGFFSTWSVRPLMLLFYFQILVWSVQRTLCSKD